MREVVSQAKYMVLGLGDVYLGAPCAVPVDPRCALTVLDRLHLGRAQSRPPAVAMADYAFDDAQGSPSRTADLVLPYAAQCKACCRRGDSW